MIDHELQEQSDLKGDGDAEPAHTPASDAGDHEPIDVEIPEPNETLDARVDDDTVIVVRRHGNPDGRRLLLSHGNGLAIDAYAPFWSELRADYDLMLFDMRNHGWNDLGAIEQHTMLNIARDFDRVHEAIDSHFGLEPAIGVYHSTAAIAALLSPSRGKRYQAMVLFDPPVFRPGLTPQKFDLGTSFIGLLTRGRKATFESIHEFAQSLKVNPFFPSAAPELPYLMGLTTLRESDEAGGYVLRCPPEYEARILDYIRMYADLVDITTMECPIKAVGSDPSLRLSYLPSDEFNSVYAVDYDFIPDASHYLVLERPDECIALMTEYLGSISST